MFTFVISKTNIRGFVSKFLLHVVNSLKKYSFLHYYVLNTQVKFFLVKILCNFMPLPVSPL